MKGFQYQDVGLFTFYREQAEYEAKKQAEKREKALRKQRKAEEKNGKLKEPQEPKQIKYACPSPTLETPRQNPTAKAKKYLKELEESGHKLVYDHKKRQRRYNKSTTGEVVNEKPQFSISINPLEKVDEKIVSSMQEIFIKKKDYSKFNYFQMLDKEPIMPKEFNSIQIFQMGIMPGQLTKQQSEDLMRRKSHKDINLSSKKIPNLLPELYNSARPSPSVPVYKREKDRRNYYNPIDIILNNEKFKLKDIKKPYNSPNKQTEPNTNGDTVNANSSVLEIIKKYRMIK